MFISIRGGVNHARSGNAERKKRSRGSPRRKAFQFAVDTWVIARQRDKRSRLNKRLTPGFLVTHPFPPNHPCDRARSRGLFAPFTRREKAECFSSTIRNFHHNPGILFRTWINFYAQRIMDAMIFRIFMGRKYGRIVSIYFTFNERIFKNYSYRWKRWFLNKGVVKGSKNSFQSCWSTQICYHRKINEIGLCLPVHPAPFSSFFAPRDEGIQWITRTNAECTPRLR